MEQDGVRILVGIPYHDPATVPSAVGAIDALDRCGHQVDRWLLYGYGVDAARNRIAAKALAVGYDWLLMVDADVMVPPDALANLMEHDADVCMGWYPNRHDHGDSERTCLYREGIGWNYYRSSELEAMRDAGKHTLRVNGGGMGCCLFRVSVFEGIPFPWFVWTDESWNRKTGDVKSCGEDIDFCIKCGKSRIPIYADTRVRCEHLDLSWE